MAQFRPTVHRFGQCWIRLKHSGEVDKPLWDYVAEKVLFRSSWISSRDIYSFIALQNKRDFELCFCQEAPLRCVLEIVSTKGQDWNCCYCKFWIVRMLLRCQMLNFILESYCDIVQPPTKPVNKLSMQQQIFIQIPNSFSGFIQWPHYLFRLSHKVLHVSGVRPSG